MASYCSHKKKIASIVCINERLSDEELRTVLWKLKSERDKEAFGLVCKRWLYLQSAEVKKLRPYSSHRLRELAARFTSIVELDLSQNIYPRITDSHLGVIVDCFRCLRLLNLQNCKGITDAGMVKIGRGLSSLQHLDVSYCDSLNDEGLLAIAEGCCNLQSLDFSWCIDFSNKVLEALSKNCHNLQVLGMQGCNRITDFGLKSLVSGCQLIKRLDITNCTEITVVGIGVLLDKCHSLEYLDVRLCPHVTKASCDEAGLQFPKCCTLNFSYRF